MEEMKIIKIEGKTYFPIKGRLPSGNKVFHVLEAYSKDNDISIEDYKKLMTFNQDFVYCFDDHSIYTMVEGDPPHLRLIGTEKKNYLLSKNDSLIGECYLDIQHNDANNCIEI